MVGRTVVGKLVASVGTLVEFSCGDNMFGFFVGRCVGKLVLF